MKTGFLAMRLAAAVISLGLMGNVGYADTSPYPNAPANTKSAENAGLPYSASEAVKLYQAGVSKDVILGFVNNSTSPCHLTADQIIYMQRLGMPQEITQAMIARDTQLQQQYAMQQSYQQQMAATANNGAATQPPVVVTPTTPAPNVTVAGSDYPAYDYWDSYPYWNYPVVIGGGWGWPGWGWGWGRGFHGGFRGGFGGFHGGFHGGGFHGGGFHGGGFHGGGFGGHGGGHR